MSERILVTGATGFVGSNLIRKLIRNGYEVHIFTRNTSDKWRINNILPDLNEHVVDLLEEKKLKDLTEHIEPDVIFHLANLGVYGGVHSPDKKVFETNLFGTINLINACDNVDYQCFVNTGSSAEYGPKKSSMKETDVCEPVNVYGISKCASTLYGSFIAKTKDKPIIGLRLFSPFGPYDDKSRLMTYSITNALQNKPLMLANPGSVRDYIYIEDVLDLYIQSIGKASKIKSEVFNVGSGSQKTSSYVVNKIIEITDSISKVKWNSIQGRSHDAQKWEANNAKLRKCFNWKQKYQIDEGIRLTVSWFENNMSLYI